MANKTLLVIFLFVLELMDMAVSANKVKSKYCQEPPGIVAWFSQPRLQPQEQKHNHVTFL